MPVKDKAGVVILAKDEFIKPNTTAEGLAKLNPSFEMMGQMGFDAIALQNILKSRKFSMCIMPVTPPVLSMVPRWCYWPRKSRTGTGFKTARQSAGHGTGWC